MDSIEPAPAPVPASVPPEPPQVDAENPPAPSALHEPAQRNTNYHRSTAFLLFFLATGALIALLYWQRRLFQKASPFIPVVIPSLIAGGQIIFKDWRNYKPKYIRFVLLGFVIVAGTWGCIYQNQQLRDKAADKASAAASKSAQDSNTARFLAAADVIHKELTDLKVGIKTQDLQDKIANLEDRLQKTQAALSPAPKASLTFSLPGFNDTADYKSMIPVRDGTFNANADGVVHVPITVFNITDSDANQGHINFYICPACRYSREPNLMMKVPGMSDQTRDFVFRTILANDSIRDVALDIVVPYRADVIEIAASYRCQTCSLQNEGFRALVHVKWP